ncbi:hypothetical protein EDB19DRAFT_486420 [Suillus lakei]|nr:hypothetical protein EDB19DRAFT_486420 [Suillus lakei]
MSAMTCTWLSSSLIRLTACIGQMVVYDAAHYISNFVLLRMLSHTPHKSLSISFHCTINPSVACHFSYCECLYHVDNCGTRTCAESAVSLWGIMTTDVSDGRSRKHCISVELHGRSSHVSCSLRCFQILLLTATTVNSMIHWGLFHSFNKLTCFTSQCLQLSGPGALICD